MLLAEFVPNFMSHRLDYQQQGVRIYIDQHQQTVHIFLDQVAYTQHHQRSPYPDVTEVLKLDKYPCLLHVIGGRFDSWLYRPRETQLSMPYQYQNGVVSWGPVLIRNQHKYHNPNCTELRAIRFLRGTQKQFLHRVADDLRGFVEKQLAAE